LGFASLQIMSEEELKLLAADPLVTICSHGLSHRSLGRLSAEAIRKELIASRQKLKELTELNVEGFCFPFGQRADIPANAGQLLQKAGYSYGLSTIWGRKTHPNQVFEIRRIEICPADDLRTFANKLLGFQAKWQFRQLARDGKSKLSGLFQHRAIG
jgi:peptidoglycan/xylan/chitin deacetylase (PgdA/CDA1 family)